MRSNEVSVTNNNENLVIVFDESTCSGDSVCDIFENEDNIITENSIVFINNNKSIWKEKAIKTTFSEFTKDYNN